MTLQNILVMAIVAAGLAQGQAQQQNVPPFPGFPQAPNAQSAAPTPAPAPVQAQQQPIPPLPGFPGAPTVQGPARANPAPANPAPAQTPVAQPPQAQPQPPAAPVQAAPAQLQNALPAAPQTTQPAVPPPSSVRIGNLSLQNASLTEVIDQLARQLHLNYILDPAVKGSIVLNTYGDTANMDARNLLELILRVNNAGMVKEGDIWRIVPLKQATKMPLRPEVNAKNIPDDDQIMLNLVFLKYVTVDELTKVLGEFAGENSSMFSYAPANLLFILDSRRNMRRTMELISLFDSDTFANQRVRLFDIKNTRPSDLEKDLEKVLKAISLDDKNSPVRFLPVDRINILIAVAPNPGVFDTIADWLQKLDVPVQAAAGAIETHVYRVRYGRSECLAMALNQLYGVPTGGAGYGGGFGGGYGGYGGGYPSGGYGAGYGGGFGGGYGGGYGGGFGGGFAGMGGYNNSTNAGGYGAANNFNGSFGGSGGCGGAMVGGYGGGYGGAQGAYGYPVFGGYSAQAPANTVGQPAGTAPGTTSAIPGPAPVTAPRGVGPDGQPLPAPPRIVPNPLDNALIISADAQVYQAILKVLKDLDVPPRQILLEAKIYSVDLTGTWTAGVSAGIGDTSNPNSHELNGLESTHTLLGAFSSNATQLNAGALVGRSRELLAQLNLSENIGRSHVLSEPSLIATDSIPATLTVGSQIPVSTGSTTIPTAGGTAVSNSLSSENTGVTLQVNARVNPSGVVTLIINQQVSTPGPGAGTLTPSFNQQVVQTQLTMQDGDTIAIGGLIGETTTDGIAGIPLLDRIPYIGGILFGTRNHSHERTELIIFMTPHVIYDESGLVEASNELRDRVKKLQRYVKEL